MNLWMFSVLIILFLTACSSSPYGGDRFYVIESSGSSVGEAYMYNPVSSPFIFVIDTAGTYHNLTDLNAGKLDGFNFSDVAEELGGSYLTCEVNGTYSVCLSMSFSSSANGGLYGLSAAKNFNQSLDRNCYARRAAISTVGNMAFCCILDLDVGDTLNVKVENENTNRNMMIHTTNLDVVII